MTRIRIVAVTMLSIAGIINYLDRGSLAIANTTIRADLGFSATRMGVLLSAFSLSYAVCQLPVGLLLDRYGERRVLGVSLFLWSLTQSLTAFVAGFGSFLVARAGLAAGESPFVVSAVKTVNDWFSERDRATPMGIVNAITTMGQAIAPPILTFAMLRFGWRGMFVLIGLPGMLLAGAWYAFYRDREDVSLAGTGVSGLAPCGSRSAPARISLRQWTGLFRLRTVWGMMLGFGGINYTVWFYMSWMPNYLEDDRHLSIASTGILAVIPFSCGALGMVLSGIAADGLMRRGMPPKQCHRALLLTGMSCSAASTLLTPYLPGASGAACGIGLALFFIYVAGNSGWCLVGAIAPPGVVASVAGIQNFGSFVCASIAPVVTGWLLDRTHSFRLPLVICAMMSILGAGAYLFIVDEPIALSPAP